MFLLFLIKLKEIILLFTVSAELKKKRNSTK
jgi:hypothetical protein